MKSLLLDYTENELCEITLRFDPGRFRAKQLYTWLSSGTPFGEMSNLPKKFREDISAEYDSIGAAVENTYVSADGTVKFLLKLNDGNLIESVLMRNNYGDTLCVSTQVGCRMGCKFCASGRDGLLRNLTPGEMLSEVIIANKYLKEICPDGSEPERVGNVVLMGSGEPLDNYDNTVKFIRLLAPSQGIGQRSVSLSTCGLVEKIRCLAEEDLSVTLCISLHSPFDEKRVTVMPTANKYKVKDIMEAAKYYFEKTKRRVIIEYAMMKGFNTSVRDVEELKKLTRGMSAHINLIPLNNTDSGLSSVTKKESYAFLNLLTSSGLSATIRRSQGGDISGACGQLKRRYLNDNK